jgi:hypothetical protein
MPTLERSAARPLICFFLLCIWTAPLCAYEFSDPIDRALSEKGFIKKDIPGEFFSLRSWSKITNPLRTVHLYIEGDGRNYLTPRHISKNPTPRSSLVRNFCLIDPSDNVIYLARPCQFTDPSANPGWGKEYWTHKRFAPEVITEINRAISWLKGSYSLRDFYLYGYSGGAAVATLIAAKRSDIAGLVSVAGNLDHNAVNDFHNAPRMPESLNPADLASEMPDIPQIHLLGEKDRVIPPNLAGEFIRKLPSPAKARIISVPGATHTAGWLPNWPELLKEIDSFFEIASHSKDSLIN